MKFKRAGIITKVVILILVAYLAILLLSVRAQIRGAETNLQTLQTQVDEQTADIANRNDPDTVLAIAKERMRLVESGEIIFYDTTN